MKIRSEKAMRIAVPLFVKFILEAKKMGYEYSDETFRDIAIVRKGNPGQYWQNLIALYDRFIEKLHKEFLDYGIWPKWYIGKHGIKFADVRKALDSFFVPQDKDISIVFDVKRGWAYQMRSTELHDIPDVTLGEIAQDYKTPFEKMFMEVLRDYNPEIASPNMIKLNDFIEIKRTVYDGYLFFNMSEKIGNWGMFVNDTQCLKHLKDKVIFMERCKALINMAM